MRFFPVAIAAVLDLLSVGAFVAIGRASHAEAASLAGFLGTAWPFAVGLVAGWAAMRAWRHPMQVAWTGVGIWLCTVVLGLALRALLTPDGAPLSFAVVTTVFLGGAMIGWRELSRPFTMVRRARARTGEEAEAA
ncbi:DUF3054 domain-containing protein [Nocardiopsis composta]|uniref:DUF3054 domain-containing protein n=1 Tax=Nocardiopsis composta TaxID=157465 RepID=A0A7W8VFP0_9ACTN|nr:DUF3054 domain-containing protein [Nocardiopsis composta]MBB5434756.1 hypothetical protein [Nocardiopsis composta]